ncbi:hypothetical protein [Polaromonas sp. SM01]|uniref:hypothetical protein n=1 Tax=Polaromonas sp. SM01 TaxID=3085630 RepID=UPI00298275FB|nr:hypothetical protein [Polaromonas sp. SM01]MDW5442478.1 hypothetical protein [Polaromonas sp. SM01]
MAYAAYRESFGASRFNQAPEERGRPERLMVLELTVPSCEAFQVRRLLAGCPDTGVLRCVPRPHDSLVRLEILLPENRVAEIMHVLMTRIPSGEMGALNSWRRHLTNHGLTHGF